ncbi:MAG: hypothetical protein HC822_18510 [Oscillochloris sp.]|nr:hypothetical protein [Oscillochloris sp.]
MGDLQPELPTSPCGSDGRQADGTARTGELCHFQVNGGQSGDFTGIAPPTRQTAATATDQRRWPDWPGCAHWNGATPEQPGTRAGGSGRHGFGS